MEATSTIPTPESYDIISCTPEAYKPICRIKKVPVDISIAGDIGRSNPTKKSSGITNEPVVSVFVASAANG